MILRICMYSSFYVFNFMFSAARANFDKTEHTTQAAIGNAQCPIYFFCLCYVKQCQSVIQLWFYYI